MGGTSILSKQLNKFCPAYNLFMNILCIITHNYELSATVTWKNTILVSFNVVSPFCCSQTLVRPAAVTGWCFRNPGTWMITVAETSWNYLQCQLITKTFTHLYYFMATRSNTFHSSWVLWLMSQIYCVIICHWFHFFCHLIYLYCC